MRKLRPLTPRLSQTERGLYEVTLPIPTGPSILVPVVIGSTRKCKAPTSTEPFWEPSTRYGIVKPRRMTRRAAVAALLRAYVKNPKTLAASSPHAEMISLCRQIARTRGTIAQYGIRTTFTNPKSFPPWTHMVEFFYEDPILRIFAGGFHGGLEIVRKAMPSVGMIEPNPCLMVTGWGVCIRAHNETHHLETHVKTLAESFGLKP